MNSLKGKIALITGSARGLGKAIAERYAALGADIVLNYSRDKVAADETVSNIEAMGKIDIVVANAGIELVETPVTAFTEEQFDHVFSINTKGSYFTMQQGAKHMVGARRPPAISSTSCPRRSATAVSP